jgi:hypothetical protein
MVYRVVFRKRFNAKGGETDDPARNLGLPDGVLLDASFVERTEPQSLHGQEEVDEDDDFEAFGTESWDCDVADGREDEFKFAMANSEVVMEYEELDEEVIGRRLPHEAS